MDDLDAEELRRFTFKIRFLHLDSHKRTTMFARFPLGNPASNVQLDIAKQLGKLDCFWLNSASQKTCTALRPH